MVGLYLLKNDTVHVFVYAQGQIEKNEIAKLYF